MTAACAIGDFQPRPVNAALAWICKVVASSLLIAPTWAPFSTVDVELVGERVDDHRNVGDEHRRGPELGD